MRSPLVEWELERLAPALSAIGQLSTGGQISNPDAVQSEVEESLGMPRSSPDVREMILHPFMLASYLSARLRAIGEYTGDEAYSSLREVEHRSGQEATHLRVRRFRAHGGVYFGQPFHSDDAWYAFWDQEPVLLTKVPRPWLEESSLLWSGVAWISRPEVRILSALLFCTPSSHGPGFCFQPCEYTYDLPWSLVATEGSSDAEVARERARTAVQIMSRLEEPQAARRRSDMDRGSHYRFRLEGIDSNRVEKFRAAFDVGDSLTLRTAFLLLKSAAVWGAGNKMLEEDSVANLFFGLEGCLRLIHRRFLSGNFEIGPTLDHVEAAFRRRPGYRWMLENSYEQRIWLVHPEPRNQSDWLPPIQADDYYENYAMAIDLIHYAVTGDLLPFCD